MCEMGPAEFVRAFIASNAKASNLHRDMWDVLEKKSEEEIRWMFCNSRMDGRKRIHSAYVMARELDWLWRILEQNEGWDSE